MRLRARSPRSRFSAFPRRLRQLKTFPFSPTPASPAPASPAPAQISASPAAGQSLTAAPTPIFAGPVFISGGLIEPAPTPYHFLVYEDVPSDQNSPYWPHDFWSPLKFIPLDDGLPPGSYINFNGLDRERIEHWNTRSSA